MIYSAAMKHGVIIKPQSIGTTAVTGIIDTLGAAQAQILAVLDTAATSVTITTLKVSEGDTTSAFTDITEFTGGTNTGNFTLPTGPGTGTATGQIVGFDIDLRKRKRYLQVSLANSAARLSSVVANLDRLATKPTDASGRGLATLVPEE